MMSERPESNPGEGFIPITDTRTTARTAGLTLNPVPPGWTERHAAAHTPPGAGPGRAPSTGRAPRRRKAGGHKLWRYFKTLRNMLFRRAVVPDLPIHLQMESTDACNLHCTSCSRDMLVEKAKLLDESLWKKVIDEVRPTNINVSGIGEPLLHPEIFKIIRYAKEQGAAVNCATNFTRVKGRHREIVESGINQLKISIDSCRPETYRIIRGEDFFPGILDDIRTVQEWKERLGTNLPSIRFNFALQRLNFTEAADLVDLAADLGVEGIYYQYLSYTDMEDRKVWLTADMTREALRRVLDEANRRAEAKGVATNLSVWERDFDILWSQMQPMEEYTPNAKPCYFPWMSAWIGADGWIRPCPIMPWTLDEGRMGHLGEQSFQEIWNNDSYRELRQALARGERPTRSCKTCYPQDLYNIFLLKSKLLPGK